MRHRPRIIVGLALALGLLAGPAWAAATRASASEIHVRILGNGMKILVWPDHDIPNVVVYNWFHVGSRNERPGITGLSHFFEHMMFKGSKHYPPGEFDRVMEQNGGANNAFTSEDVTCYQDWFPKSILELVFRLEADRICCLSFDPKAVQSEREVVYSERRTSVDNDNASLLDEQLQAAAYVGHPYHNPVIGWPSDIERWTIEDLQEYFRVHYAPNNATMVVAGDVTPEEVFALAEKYFGPIPAVAQPPEEITKEPPQIGERRVTLKKFGQTPLLEMAFHIGASADKDAEARVILVNILGAGESSRLYRRLVDQDRLAIDASAFQNPSGFDPGLLKIAVTVAPAKTLEATEKALLEELAKIGASGVTEAELRKAKNAAQSGYWRQLETINAKAASLGSFQMMRGDYHALFTSPERFEKVTRAQVQDLARRTFDEKNRTVGVLIPEKAEASR
ncbi:MAG TPA: pitrilysin family protein [Candidatus Angelobacter sp.]|nr:pitrilysin family protein [Candidatus Angelobacter sp.]